MRVGWKPAEGVVQRDAGECTDVAGAIFDGPEVVEIGHLPFYNQDLERMIDPPPAADVFRFNTKFRN